MSGGGCVVAMDSYNRLVKLVARAFYDEFSTKGDSQKKSGRSDDRGIAVVVLDALTKKPWVREEDLAKELKLHSKQLRRTLRFFEEEKLVTREDREETAKGVKIHIAALAATVNSQNFKEGEEKIKLHTHSYCCLDYAQIHNVVRYRLQRMRKLLQDQLDNNNTVQDYICHNCSRRYNAFDAMRLISMEEEDFHCKHCNGVLKPDSDKLAVQEGGDGDENVKRRRRENLKEMLQKVEVQLEPLVAQLNRLKDVPAPDYGTLQAWEASAIGRGLNGDSCSNDSKSFQGFVPAMPFGETKVEVDFGGGNKKEDVKSEMGNMSMKVLPPWMIKQRMVLIKEQRGEVKEESKMDSKSAALFSDDKESANENKDNNLQEEYPKAHYYDAMLKQQQEPAEAAKKQQELSQTSTSIGSESSNRQVDMKSKRELEGDEGGEWEEPPAGKMSEGYRVHDLNVEAEAPGEDDEDIDLEEGSVHNHVSSS